MIAKELKKVQSNLRKIIECSICTSVLNDPVRTPCNHKFCRDCINRVVIKKSAGDCPLCNHVLSKRSLKSSNRLTAVINSTKLLIDALNEDNNLEEIKESATSHENLLEDSVNNAVTLRNSLRCSTPIKGNAFGKRNCDKVSKKFKRDLPLVSELDQENLQIPNLINPDSLDPIQSTKRRKTTVLDDSTTVLDYLARDDLIGGGKKSPERISTKNSDITLHSIKNQPSNRLITALNRQQNVLIEPEEDCDPYQFIPSQTLSKNLKRSGRKLKKTAAKVESKQPRRRTLPKKKKDIFESLRNSSVSSEEEVNEDVHALFLTPQLRLKDYSRVPKRKSQNKKAEIPMSFSLFRRRNSSVSQRSQWRKQQIESKTPNPTNTKKKQQLKRRSERISSRKKPDRTNDISPSNTNENLKFSENTSEAEEPSSKKRVSEIRFNRSRSEVTEKEGRTSTLHDGIFISEQVNILNKTKPLSIVIENMKNNFVSVSKNLLSSKSSTDALESKSINPNKNDNEGIFSTNENLETCSITNKELENECVETRLVDREISVDEGVNLTDEDIFKPSDKFDEVSAGNNFSNILLCPTQVYVDSSEEETENNPSDSKQKIELDQASKRRNDNSKYKTICVNCGNPSNLVVKKSFTDASFQTNIEFNPNKTVDVACQTDLGQVDIEKSFNDACFQTNIDISIAKTVVDVACQMDVVQNNEDVCVHDDDVKSFQSWTTLNENKQENLKSYSPQPDENAQSGQTLTENGNTLVSDSSSGTTRKSDNPPLIFSNYFKNINQYQSDEVEGKKSSSNQMNENCNLMSQTQLVSTQLYESDVDLFEEDETEEKEILQGNYHSESDDSSLNPLIRSNRKVNRIDSSSVSSLSNESRASIKSHGDDLIAGDHLLLQTGSNVQNEVAENDCEKKFIDCDLGNDSKSLFTKDNETNDDFCKETDDLSKSNVVEVELLESEILQDKISTGKLKRTKRGLAKYSSQENSNNSLQTENVNNNFLDETIKYTSKRNRNSFSSGSIVNINPRSEELHQSPNEKQSNEIPKDEIEHTSPKAEKVQNSTSLITNQTSNIATTEEKTKLNSQEIEHVESKGDDMSQDVLPPTPTNQSQFSNNFRDGNIEGSWESFPLTEIEALENEFTRSRQLQQQTHQSPTEDLKNTGSSTAKIKKSLSDVFNSNNKNSDIKSDSTIVIKNARDDSLSGIEEMIDSRTCQTSNSNSQECLEGDLSKVIVNAEADVAIGNKNVIENEESNIKKNMEKSTENRLPNAEESAKYKFEITKIESEVLEVDRRSGKSSGGISQQICIVASGLSPSELRIIIDFTKKIQAEFHPKFNKHTTHVVVKTDESRLCQRTLKYFQGMAAGIWVVSYKWILNSLRTGNILPEEDFEVTGDMVHGIHYGPQKSRTSKIKLLRDYEICCMGEFQELSREDLVDLAEQFGATTVLDPSMFPFQSKMRIIIVQLFKEQKKIQDMCTKYQVMAITRDWLLDSMTNHECLPYDNYRYIKPRETKKV